MNFTLHNPNSIDKYNALDFIRFFSKKREFSDNTTKKTCIYI